MIKVKIIRELDSNTINDIYKNKRIKIITKTNSQKNYQNLNLNIYNKYNQYNSKTYRRINKQKFLNSPAMIEISPNYNEIISPVGYINNNNYSSGSENEDNHMRSFDDRNKYNLDKIKKIKKINYELEDPESFNYLQKKEIKRINKGRNLSRKNKDERMLWLKRKTEPFGAILDVFEGEKQHIVFSHDKENSSFINAYDYMMIIRITNKEIFESYVQKGLGRGKAYGCGLMLFRISPE